MGAAEDDDDAPDDRDEAAADVDCEDAEDDDEDVAGTLPTGDAPQLVAELPVIPSSPKKFRAERTEAGSKLRYSPSKLTVTMAETEALRSTEELRGLRVGREGCLGMERFGRCQRHHPSAKIVRAPPRMWSARKPEGLQQKRKLWYTYGNMSVLKPTAAPPSPPDTRGSVVVVRLRWALPFLGTLLPIVLLSFFSYRISSDSIAESVEATNLSAVSNLSQLMTQDVLRTISLAHAVAALPGTAEAIKQRDETSMANRLKAIVLSYPNVNRAFLTDKDGAVWSDYPPAPGHYGKNMTSAPWFVPALVSGKNVLSEAYPSPLSVPGLVMAVGTPVKDEDGSTLGVLVFEYDLAQVNRWIQSIRLSHNGFLYVVDGEGVLAAHPQPFGSVPLDAYADTEEIVRAREGTVLTGEYDDAVSGERMLATFQSLSVGKSTWVVVAQQPVAAAFASLERVKVNIALAGGALTLLTLGMVVALARTTARAERLNRQLQTANMALRDFASIVSHQLKAPITSMRWILESILDGTYGPVSNDVQEPLRELQDVNIKNHLLITDILNISRIERGVVTATLAPVALGDVVHEAAKNYLEMARRQGVALVLDIPAQPITVLADRDKFAEAVSNSISNALKHTPSGSITVRARTDGANGVITVEDTGKGMSQETLSKLFTRDQILGANIDPEKSTGLGLYIARSFMRLQNGEISARSAPGKGSTFIYTIPLAPQAA